MATLIVSLSEEARQRIDHKAAQRGVTRSAYIRELVAADAAAELDRYRPRQPPEDGRSGSRAAREP